MKTFTEEKTFVDIILPNYNSFEFVEETINSIIAQTYQNWHLYIIDDHSTDNSLQIINKFSNLKKVTIVKLSKNKGAGFCRNLALRLSKSKYVAFIDSDDIWEKNKLQEQLEIMDNTNLDFTYTDYISFKEVNKNKKFKKKIIPPENFTYESFSKNTSICTSTMIIKREKIGTTKFTKTKICEDYFFKCELLKHCRIAKKVAQNLTLYRITKNSLQSKKYRNLYWIWHINKKYNKMSLFNNIFSIIFISINSIKKYGFK